ELGMPFDPRTPCQRLSIAQQQSVEIARALSQEAQILVMDEPSAVLTPPEVKRLFAIINQCRKRGLGLIYIGHRLDDGASEMRPRGPARQTADRSAGVGIPPGRTEPGEGRHHEHAPGVGDRCRERTDLGRLGDDAETVTQPLDGGPGDEHRALEGVGHRSVGQLPGDGGQHPRCRIRAGRSDVQQDEAPGAVGVLRLSRSEAVLAEEGGLLVSGDPRDRDAARQALGRGHAQPTARGAHLGERPDRHAEQLAELRVPGERPDVEEHRSRSVRDVGEVLSAGGEAMDEPRVDRAEGETIVGRQ
ncbi:MAG: ATP-binding cassette domain-containing protein, partial [Acidimicrobiia bacterium]|nr:ATP-binding cassette domain-containing protein [Acidimicrobiia bacterium]